MDSVNCAGLAPRYSRLWAIRQAFWLTLALAMAQLTGAATAQPPVMIVGNDPGGSVPDRLALIERLRRDGTRVEITGDYCLSACTLYLGLPRACADPDTVFGFHGPGSAVYGIGLTPDAFDHWSRVMARHYPERLRGWYLSVARKRTTGFYSVKGSALIEMGVASCRHP